MNSITRIGGGLAALVLAATGAMSLPSSASEAGSSDAASTSNGSARATTPECLATDVRVRFHATDAAMSHRFGDIVVRNVSGRTCRSGGYGGLSYVGGGDGTQVGAAAERDSSGPRPHAIVLLPGGRARSQVSATVAGVYPKHTCRPAHVDGFRVYLPNETHAVFVAHPTTGCRNPEVHLLSHRAFH